MIAWNHGIIHLESQQWIVMNLGTEEHTSKSRFCKDLPDWAQQHYAWWQKFSKLKRRLGINLVPNLAEVHLHFSDYNKPTIRHGALMYSLRETLTNEVSLPMESVVGFG